MQKWENLRIHVNQYYVLTMKESVMKDVCRPATNNALYKHRDGSSVLEPTHMLAALLARLHPRIFMDYWQAIIENMNIATSIGLILINFPLFPDIWK